jgi:hypothetical protein
LDVTHNETTMEEATGHRWTSKVFPILDIETFFE